MAFGFGAYIGASQLRRHGSCSIHNVDSIPEKGVLMTNVRDKIKKLLALGENNTNEHEAARAMEMAAAMMAAHGIKRDELRDHSGAVHGDRLPWEYPFWRTVARAAAHLYGGRSTIATDGTWLSFIGRREVVDAAEDTFAFIILQIEALYRAALPKGLTKVERSSFRKTFKEAAARRVEERVEEIIRNLVTEGSAAQKSTGSTALVIVANRELMLAEVREALKGIKTAAAPKPVKLTEGTLRGLAAGDLVDLNQKVG